MATARALVARTSYLITAALILASAAGCSSDGGGTQGCEDCQGGCGADSCLFDCATAACNDRVINCPADRPCTLSCNGLDACDTTTVQCPDEAACSVQCEGRDACGDMILHCGAGDCSITCGTDSAACEGATINCGSGSCSATCQGTSQPAMNDCESAASCTQC